MIKRDGGEAVFVRTDVSQADDVEAAVRAAVGTFGWSRLRRQRGRDRGPKPRCSPTATRQPSNRLVAVNLKSVFLCLKYEIRAIARTGRRSDRQYRLDELLPPAAEAGGVHGHQARGRRAHQDRSDRVRGIGHRVNAVAPGAIDTPMLRGAMAARGSKGGGRARPAEPDRPVRAARGDRPRGAVAVLGRFPRTRWATCWPSTAATWRGSRSCWRGKPVIRPRAPRPTIARVRSIASVAASSTGMAASSGLITSGPTQRSAPIWCNAWMAATRSSAPSPGSSRRDVSWRNEPWGTAAASST